jgi:hypothetical protein
MNIFNILLQRFAVLFFVCFLLFCKSTLNTVAQVTIVVNKGSFGSVGEAAISEEKVNWWDANLTDDRACTECFAATELSSFLKLCTSLTANDIQYSSPGKMPAKGDVFLLGSRTSNPLISSKILPESSELKTDQSLHIYAYRENNRTITIIEGKDRVGTLYGVYAYLEQLGFSFYGLGEQGTVYPGKLTQLPQKMDIIQNPSYLTRGFIGLGDRGDKDIYYWMSRNRMNYGDETGKDTPFRKKLGMVLARGGHEVQGLFIPPGKEYPYNHPKFQGDKSKPKDPYAVSNEYAGDTNGDGKLSYFEAHPEWYGLHNGKRSDKADVSPGDNYCTSNKDATKELAKNLVQSLIDGDWKNVDIVDFWMLDNGKWCECENCKKQGIFSDRLMDIAYTVQKEIQKAQQEKRLNRNVLLSTLAYHETMPAPERPLPKDFDYDHFSVTFSPIERCYVHTMVDPACTEINKSILENYQGWTMGSGRNYKGSIMIGEYYNVSSFKSLPIVFPHIMAADIPWYYRTGAKHFNYMHTPTHVWGTWTLNNYLMARLLWNVETDADSLLNSFFNKYYGDVSNISRNYYQHLEKAYSNLKPFKHYAGYNHYSMPRRLMNDTLKIFTLDHLHYEAYHPVLNDGPDIVEMIDELGLARKGIDAAMLQCTDKTVQARLIDDDRRIAYGEAMVYFYYHLVRIALLHRRSEVNMAKHEFLDVEKYAEILRNITDLVAPIPGFSNGDANAKDGLEATQAVDVYEYFKQKYGN